jgi:protein-S-isoprenylcysteine O-methyltransferase Ste14
MRYTLNFFKGTTWLWILFLIYYFHRYTTPAYLYLFMHGSYGLGWVVKDIYFPDARFKARAALGSHLMLATLLIGYWMIPVPLMLGYGLRDPSFSLLALIVVIYVIGLTLMVGSDYQKNTTLKKRKGIRSSNTGLISSGFFSRSRNPNYFG